MTVYVYGASDDLIEIEGSLRQEFYYCDAGYANADEALVPYYLAFSDGTLLKITYDGEWNIKLVEGQAIIHHCGGSASHPQVDFRVPDYSDLAVIHSDVTWVVGGTDVVK